MKKILLTILAVLAMSGMAMAQTAPSDINLHRNEDGSWSFIMPGRNLVMSTETFSTNDTVNGHYLAGVPEGCLILALGDTVPVSNDSLRRTTPITEGTPVTIVPTGNLRRIKSITLVDEAPAEAVSLIVNPVVGQVIGSDGKNYDANATLPTGVTAVAKICYVGSDNGEDAPYNHGLALALSDANGGSTIQWGYSTTTDNSQHPNYSNSSFTIESGLQYNNATHNSDNYKAFKAAMANNSTAAPTGCSDWFLASGYQWTKMIAGAGSAGNLKSLAGLTNNYYWTGSENSAGKAWRYEFNKTRFYSVYKNQSESWVRACLAF